MDWFTIGKGVRQGCILSPCLFNLHAEYIMRNAGLGEAQAGIKTAGRNINNLRYVDDTTLTDTTLTGRKWRGTKEPPEKLVYRSRSNSYNQTWNNGLVQNWVVFFQGCIFSPCLFNLYAEYFMWSAGLDEAQAGIKIAGRDVNNLGYSDDTTLIAES